MLPAIEIIKNYIKMCFNQHATVFVLGLDETFFGNFLGLNNQPVLIAPSGPLGPGWGLKNATKIN